MITDLAGSIPGIVFPVFAPLLSFLAFYGKEISAMLKKYTSPATRTGTLILSLTATAISACCPVLVPSL